MRNVKTILRLNILNALLCKMYIQQEQAVHFAKFMELIKSHPGVLIFADKFCSSKLIMKNCFYAVLERNCHLRLLTRKLGMKKKPVKVI